VDDYGSTYGKSSQRDKRPDPATSRHSQLPSFAQQCVQQGQSKSQSATKIGGVPSANCVHTMEGTPLTKEFDSMRRISVQKENERIDEGHGQAYIYIHIGAYPSIFHPPIPLRELNDEGTCPVSRFEWSSSSTISSRFPIADGIEPTNELELRSIRIRLRKLPNSGRILPESRLEERSIDSSCERFPISLGM